MRANYDEQNKANDNQDLPPEPKKKKKKSKLKHINKWKHSYLPVFNDFKWNLPIPALDSHEPQSSLFEKILTDDILRSICNESVTHAQNKGNNSYKPELHNMTDFTAILLISRYVDLHRRPMFCGNVQLMFTMMLFLR